MQCGPRFLIELLAKFKGRVFRSQQTAKPPLPMNEVQLLEFAFGRRKSVIHVEVPQMLLNVCQINFQFG